MSAPDGVVDAIVEDWKPSADELELAARVVECLTGCERDGASAAELRHEADAARGATEFEFRIANVTACAWDAYRETLDPMKQAINGPFDTLKGFVRGALVAAAKAGYAEGVADESEKGPF